MEWFRPTIEINGFSMVLGSGNHWKRWISMVFHHWSKDGMVTYHRWSLVLIYHLIIILLYHLIIILSNHHIILLLYYCIIVLSKEQLACFTFSKPYNQIFQQFILLFGCVALTGINRGKQSIIKKHTSTMTLNLKHTHFRNYSKKDQQNLGRSLERRF